MGIPGRSRERVEGFERVTGLPRRQRDRLEAASRGGLPSFIILLRPAGVGRCALNGEDPLAAAPRRSEQVVALEHATGIDERLDGRDIDERNLRREALASRGLHVPGKMLVHTGGHRPRGRIGGSSHRLC